MQNILPLRVSGTGPATTVRLAGGARVTAPRRRPRRRRCITSCRSVDCRRTDDSITAWRTVTDSPAAPQSYQPTDRPLTAQRSCGFTADVIPPATRAKNLGEKPRRTSTEDRHLGRMRILVSAARSWRPPLKYRIPQNPWNQFKLGKKWYKLTKRYTDVIDVFKKTHFHRYCRQSIFGRIDVKTFHRWCTTSMYQFSVANTFFYFW